MRDSNHAISRVSRITNTLLLHLRSNAGTAMSNLEQVDVLRESDSGLKTTKPTHN